nr:MULTISPECIES: hypothetical protein [Thermoanaerobacterium]
MSAIKKVAKATSKEYAKWCPYFQCLIEKNEVCLVTVNGSRYWAYRYEGALNGIDNAVVVLCWSEESF